MGDGILERRDLSSTLSLTPCCGLPMPPPGCCPLTALTTGTEADSCPRPVTGRHQEQTCSERADCTSWSRYSASLCFSFLICTMGTSQAFMRIQWDETRPPGQAAEVLAPRLLMSIRLWSGLGRGKLASPWWYVCF